MQHSGYSLIDKNDWKQHATITSADIQAVVNLLEEATGQECI